MLIDYMQGLGGLLSVLDPNNNQFLDDYCRGVVFGANSFNLMRRLARIMRGDSFELSGDEKQPWEILGSVFDKVMLAKFADL